MLTSVTENNGYACIFHGLSLTLQKIGCTSAIKASFIAFGLHYLWQYKRQSKHNEIRYIRD